MTTEHLIDAGKKVSAVRLRFVSRQHFFERCIKDITTDFHKLYGPFERDWEAAVDACEVFLDDVHEYLCARDVTMIECQLLVGAIETADTHYVRRQARRRFESAIILCQEEDSVMLKEIDAHIRDVRSLYKMIAFAEERG